MWFKSSHSIDPVLFHLGPLQVRWYGLMYVFGYVLGAKLLGRLVDQGFFKIPKKAIDSYITYLIVGMFIGARLAYVFIYNWDEYSQNWLDIFAVWKGGLSFHGAVVGMVVSSWAFARRYQVSLLQVTDAMGLAGAPGLFFGRIGNFINGELYGRVSDVPWAMVFPDGGPFPRHPSQLYEAFLEGIVLSLILWGIKNRTSYYGIVTAVFVAGYGIFRFGVEFFREPDVQLGYYFGLLTMGQILCLLMVLVGIILAVLANQLKQPIAK